MVETTGGEVSVTLLVGGVSITGFLTSTTRFNHWQARMINIALEVGSGEQDGSTEPPNAAERKEIQDGWEAEIAKAELGDGEVSRISLPSLCVRDALVMAGVPAHWAQHAYLLISADHVSAITLGFRGR
jgi:hypothetical protein